MQNVPYASAVGSIIDDTKSQTGYVFILNGDIVDWKSFKQSTTAMSATDSEYIAASKAAIEVVWIRKFISGLGEIRFLKVHTDNNLADSFTKSNRFKHDLPFKPRWGNDPEKLLVTPDLLIRGEKQPVRDTPDKLQQRFVKCIFIRYPKETMGYYFYFLPENKIVVARYAEFFKKNLITQEVSGRAIDLEEIQDEDTLPSEITSKIPMEVEGFEPPQEEVILIRRSERTHRAPDRLCLNVEVEKHSLGDLNEPASYKAAMLDSEL
nr:zinc finger, CCHC-type [Tanacetum cinerariifolium]